MGTRDQQCIDGEWNGELPACELIQEVPKPALQIEYEKALVGSRLFPVLFTAVSLGPGIASGICLVNICLIWDVFEWLGLGLIVEWDS